MICRSPRPGRSNWSLMSMISQPFNVSIKSRYLLPMKSLKYLDEIGWYWAGCFLLVTITLLTMKQ